MHVMVADKTPRTASIHFNSIIHVVKHALQQMGKHDLKSIFTHFLELILHLPNTTRGISKFVRILAGSREVGNSYQQLHGLQTSW